MSQDENDFPWFDLNPNEGLDEDDPDWVQVHIVIGDPADPDFQAAVRAAHGTVEEGMRLLVNLDTYDDGDMDNSCLICHEPFKEGELITQIGCGHEFHKDCLDQWIAVRGAVNLECPYCRTRIRT